MEPYFEQTNVFVGGEDGVNTYRIPSLMVTSQGTLLAFCEARKISKADASPTDMVLKHSEDGGRSWSAVQRVLGAAGEEAVMNPCPVIDGDTVFLFCINAHRTSPGHHRQLLVRSDDEGRTWSSPEDLTEQIIPADDTFVPGPGKAIKMRNGRFIVPGYTNVFGADGRREASYSRVVYSDDHGQSWRLGEPVTARFSNESQVVELNDGSLLLNWRDQSGQSGCRGSAVSRDNGQTWLPPRIEKNLNENPCQAGFTRFDPLGKGGKLLFSNPDTGPAEAEIHEAKGRPSVNDARRKKMTVRLSYDEGCNWPVKRMIHAGPAAYSCPAGLNDGKIALLYESGVEWKYERITLARFSLDWLEQSGKAEKGE